MKKFFIIISFLLVSVSMVAGNDETDKSEVYYGGEKGDFSLSFSALPVFNFIGNMFNGTTSQSFSGLGGVTPNVFSGTTLSCKFFTSNNMSLTVGAGFNCNKNKSFSYTENNVTQEEISINGTNEFMFLLGTNYLLRPGKRLQPVLGANVMYAFANKNFQKNDDKTEVNSDTNHRNPSNTFGVVCNLGVEYFFCKDISVSGILDLGLTTTKTRAKVDDWDEAYSRVNTSQTRFMTGKMGGNVALNFYF